MDRLVLDLTHFAAGKTEKQQAAARGPVVSGVFTSTPEMPKISFEDLLSASVRQVNGLQLEADDKVHKLATGDVDDISEVVLASSRAEIALKLLMELRNKFLDAYQSLSRISG